MQQHPILTALDGGAALTDRKAEIQELAFWTTLANAADRAVKQMHPMHPQRAEFVALASAYWRAAGQPDRARLESTG